MAKAKYDRMYGKITVDMAYNTSLLAFIELS